MTTCTLTTLSDFAGGRSIDGTPNENGHKLIPRWMFRTGPSSLNQLDPRLRSIMERTALQNPGYLQVYADNEDCEAFVQKNFPALLEDYLDLVPGAFRADLWRLLVLYQFGGIYNDLAHQYQRPVSEVVRPDAGFVSVIDTGHSGIHNAMMAAYPRHPLIGHIITFVARRLRSKRFGTSPLDLTGPSAVCKAFMEFTGLRRKSEMVRGRSTVNSTLGPRFDVHMYYLSMDRYGAEEFEGVAGRAIVDEHEKILVTTKIPDYNQIVYGAWYRTYTVRWFAGNVYRSTTTFRQMAFAVIVTVLCAVGWKQPRIAFWTAFGVLLLTFVPMAIEMGSPDFYVTE